jgi:hypothetical protein
MPQHLPVPAPEIPKYLEGLSPREAKWLGEYLVDLHGGDAAQRAGLGKTRKSQIEIGSKLKKKLAANISAALAARHDITSTAVISELGAVAFSRITDYLKIENGRIVLAVKDLNELPDEAKAAISKLRERVWEDGTLSIEIELHDKIAAMAQLGRAMGIKDRTEVDHSHKVIVEEEDPRASIMKHLAQLERNLRVEGEARATVEPPVQRAGLAPPTKALVIIEHE